MSQSELFAALARAQGKVENAKKLNKNPHFKSNYSDLATVWDTIREPLTSEGLAVIQMPCEAPPGSVGLETLLTHSAGGSVVSRFYVALKDASNPQQVGSALTYMKRYSLLGVAGIGSEDDDGNAATGKPSPAGPAVDYSKTVSETLKQLEGADETEARALYASVNNCTMPADVKNGLLAQMADIIKAKMAKTKVKK